MNSLIAIILFFLIHKIEIGLFMETHRLVGEEGESSSGSRRNVGGQQQSSSGIIQHQKRGWEKIIEEKANSHNDPPIEELAAILALFDWLANYGNEIFDGMDENIVEKPDKIFNKIIGGDLWHRIIHQVVLNFKEFIPENANTEPKILNQEQKKIFKKIKNPNTRTMLFEKMLLGAMNEVKIPQFEIDASLNKGDDEANKRRRIEHKYKFQFGFTVDCIYANYYQTELDKVNYREILKILRKMNIGGNVDEFRQILLHNNCANKQTVDVFIQSIMSTNLEFYDFDYLKNDLDEFFMEAFQHKFLNSMLQNNILEKEYSIIKLDPYFPEELPKIANLMVLADVFINMLYYIIKFTISTEIYIKICKWGKMEGILKETIRYMTNIGNLMYFIVVKHGKHYKMAMNEINNPNLRINLAKMSSKHSIFSWIFSLLYYEWFVKLKLHMAKYLTEEYFALNLNVSQKLGETADITNYFMPISKQIAEHIIQKYLNALRNEEDDQNLDAKQNEIEEKEKKKALFKFLHLRIFCVGIRQKINMKEEQQLMAKNLEFKELYSKLDLELLEILPETKAIFEHEIMPELETDNQIVDPDKLFMEALRKIRDKICRK